MPKLHEMDLKRTHVMLDQDVIRQLKAMFPQMSESELCREGLKRMLFKVKEARDRKMQEQAKETEE
jgi:Arc/MetJ-type ribon-helix-helix transcriptional regulator